MVPASRARRVQAGANSCGPDAALTKVPPPAGSSASSAFSTGPGAAWDGSNEEERMRVSRAYLVHNGWGETVARGAIAMHSALHSAGLFYARPAKQRRYRRAHITSVHPKSPATIST